MRQVIKKLTKISFLMVLVLVEPQPVEHIVLPEPIVVVSVGECVISSSNSNSVDEGSSVPSSVVVVSVDYFSEVFESELSLDNS